MSDRPVLIYANVTRLYMLSGHYDLERHPKMFGLHDGSLLITWNGSVRKLGSFTGSRLIGQVREIEAQKTQRHLCDAECKRLGHRYYHAFTEKNRMWQLRNGDLLIQSQ
jgi:hypothetical protein